MSMHLYRGFEIYPLIYPHSPTTLQAGHDYDDGFDAAVKICLRGTDSTLTRSLTFRVAGATPFSSSGAARRASIRYAENMIDTNDGERWTLG
ncbi:hypothetical protein WL80_22620 [Burkholderia ubonensis]|uniref:hypothetical protein n=1 Tax=Burkholderia ubonensis TaxID=101571 RepID=UPI00075D646B|nr:hypothetical protein [Burkholderia ubonensis]KVT44707.1 hypothetical protein WK51_04295 [Burkholderia ubonensis]KVT71920.1 hypothetical protein WK56_15800 [Burkholderia ubonensis]KVX89456.1 hypothetical protein WL08_29420 [Burkholderia ubonensis]KWE84366.1 hypothetical protein WL80_22620 [Burkholderia ubonensis]